MDPKNTKVVLALSGGVDSSVAAYLLKSQGYDISAVFMKNWEEDDTNSYCNAAEDIKDAQAVCDKLGIQLDVINFATEYWDRVFTYFLAEYKNNRTPNPDILCNKEIKFKAFLDHAITNLKADYIATGHYARVANIGGSFQLLKAKDSNKDQSYFLHALDQHQLSKSMFPLGELTKPQIRELAKSLDLITHDKKDSTGICFIGEVRFKNFLSRYLPAQPGNIVDQNNNVIGKHDGLMYYTIGQRQGLNLGGLKNYSELPWYVADKNTSNNTLLVVQGSDHPFLLKASTAVINNHFIDPVWHEKLKLNNTLEVTVKARYRQIDVPARIILDNNEIFVHFKDPQRAITPGQSIVYYQGDICLGGGVIV